MKEIEILPEDIKALRKRHGLTQKKLADSLYGVKEARIPNWEAGRRNCPSIIFWAMVLTWDKVDLYSIGLEEWRELNDKK